MVVPSEIMEQMIDAATHISKIENAASIALFGLSSTDRETVQFLCGPRDFIQAPQPEGRSCTPTDTIEVTLSTQRAASQLTMAVHLNSAGGPKEMPPDVIDMIVKSEKVNIRHRSTPLEPGEVQIPNACSLRSDFKYFPGKYDFTKTAIYHRFIENKVPVGVAKVSRQYAHRNGDYHRNMEDPVHKTFVARLFDAEYMSDDFFLPCTVKICAGNAVKLQKTPCHHNIQMSMDT